jgi:hypothetical protein
MAGAGKKTFTAGETLTASDVNSYLMEQSVMYFGGTAARSSAIPTPSTGMTTYIGTTGTASIPQIETYTGSAWQTPYGLTQVVNASFTAASSLILNNVFSAAYDNYKIMTTLTQNSTFSATFMQLRTGSTTVTSNYDRRGVFINGVSSVSGSGTAGDTYMLIGNTGNGGTSFHTIELSNPFLARVTVGTLLAADNDSGGGRELFANAIYNSNSTSYESMVIGCSSGTITGNIKIYGYRNS